MRESYKVLLVEQTEEERQERKKMIDKIMPWSCPYCGVRYRKKGWFDKHIKECKVAIPVFRAKIRKEKEYFRIFLDKVFKEPKIKLRLLWSDHKGRFLARKYFNMTQGKEAIKAVHTCITSSFEKLFPTKITT